MLMVCAAIVERAEHHEHGFKTYGDSLWWGVVTITTVGYGDIVPETRLGRVTATVLMFTGIAMLGTVAASLASLFRLEDKADEDQAAPSAPAAPAVVDTGVAEEVAAELRALRGEIAALRSEIAQRTDPA